MRHNERKRKSSTAIRQADGDFKYFFVPTTTQCNKTIKLLQAKQEQAKNKIMK